MNVHHLTAPISSCPSQSVITLPFFPRRNNLILVNYRHGTARIPITGGDAGEIHTIPWPVHRTSIVHEMVEASVDRLASLYQVAAHRVGVIGSEGWFLSDHEAAEKTQRVYRKKQIVSAAYMEGSMQKA